MMWPWSKRDDPNDAFHEVVEALLEERPEEWTNNEYHIDNKRADISIWIANGTSGIHVEVSGARLPTSWGWKHRLRRAVDKHLALKAIARLKAA